MNIGANMMSAFQGGVGTGQRIRRGKQTGEVNKLAAMGNLSGAATKATEYGFDNKAASLKQQIAQMDAGQRQKAKETASYFGQVAGAALDLPEDQRAAFASQQLSLQGFDPAILQQVGSWDDQSLTAIRNSSLDTAAQLSQANNVRDYELKAEDVRADNSLASRLGDNTVNNTQSLIADRETDNALAARLGDNTIRNTDSQISDRAADNNLNERQFSETVRVNQSKESGVGSKPDLGDVLSVRKDYEKRAKEFEGAQRNYLSMESLASDATGASDTALGFAFFKTIDPTSTVREGEFAQAASSMGLGGRAVAALKKLDSGQKFTPELRRELVAAAGRAFEQQKTDIQSLFERTSEFAERYNIPADDAAYNPIRETAGGANPTVLTYNPQTGEFG